MTIVYFIIALSILIIVHEWGHFIAARLSGIRVEKFSVGFGPKIFGLKRGDTEYKVSLIPFGGFVKMSGDDPAECDKEDEHAFYNKSVFARARVVAAGPFMNLVLCFLLMPIVFMIGKSIPAFMSETPVVIAVKAESPAALAGIEKGDLVIKVGDSDVSDWRDVIDDVVISADQKLTVVVKRGEETLTKEVEVKSLPDTKAGYIGIEPALFIGNEAVLDDVRGGSPADKAGLKAGDEVVMINGGNVEDWTDMVKAVNKDEGALLKMTVKRGEELVNVEVTPEYNEDAEMYLIGVSKDLSKRDIPMVKERYGFFASIKEGTLEVLRLAEMTFKVLGKLVTGQLSYKALGGPIQIAQATAAAARTGFTTFLFFLSFLSLQLGILNLLPIPVLDGGHLVFFGVEAIRRKPVSEKIQGIAQHVGLALILLLLTLVTFNDIMNIQFIRNILDKVF